MTKIPDLHYPTIPPKRRPPKPGKRKRPPTRKLSDAEKARRKEWGYQQWLGKFYRDNF